ncbi:hypothetical protein SEA_STARPLATINUM_210 [Streptomyces phage StarPlatinum]|uniref:Uncharacterized protein n=1 Tax=Streptomyces phage StarPlatinum TaxID=2283265 RepID=A0A345M8U8_9CAUD|nr:hypothetical protein HWB77_gp118 [Streptomyces phage StarPlatinum]AXH66919.1 hypothetical protein SEA_STARPLATINUM_210 [Streptomyces phage StarPlatinum]
MQPLRVNVGDIVCDCRYLHLKVLKIWPDGDTVSLEDGSSCSIRHCLDAADHEWQHPENY